MPTIAPYGSWASPVTADRIISGAIGLSDIVIDGSDIYWEELRPKEEGRMVIVRRTPDGHNLDMTPAPYNARTRVHEYGGGAYTVHNGVIFFSNYADQRMYRQNPGGEPHPLTPPVDMRYADYEVDPNRKLIYCVREDHTAPGEAVNTLVRISMDGDLEHGGQVTVSGNNFYSNPRMNPEGTRLCWLTWNHPNMPWDGTELWMGDLGRDGSVLRSVKVAGGKAISIFQPEWSPDGRLYYVSDQSGWWNLYRLSDDQEEALYPMQAEFGGPMWVFHAKMYDFFSADRLIVYYTQEGTDHLVSLDINTRQLESIETGYDDFAAINAANGMLICIAGSPAIPRSIIQVNLETGQVDVLRRSQQDLIDAKYMPDPQPIEFPTQNNQTAFGFFYAPKNPEFAGPENERPPLVVMSHGGPTGSTSTTYFVDVAYLTSRGIAVLDVNYGGSTGYGREYRLRLNGQWGVVDVDDCVNGARYLVDRGLVDGNRLAITGGSAGGYTTLCALAFRDAFKVGASYYGIGDLETFVHDTHKYESRYLDTLVGPYPEKAELYRQRSPIHYVDNLNCAMILLQGLEDKIVPPNQAESMYQAVKRKGLPVAYLPFEGEQHGFRKAENIKRSMEAELYFYSKIFGFNLADPIEPVKIDNLEE